MPKSWCQAAHLAWANLAQALKTSLVPRRSCPFVAKDYLAQFPYTCVMIMGKHVHKLCTCATVHLHVLHVYGIHVYCVDLLLFPS